MHQSYRSDGSFVFSAVPHGFAVLRFLDVRVQR